MPGFLREFFGEKLRRVALHENLCLKVDAGGEAKVLVAWPGIAVDTSVLTTAIRVQAEGERYIGAVVFGEDRPGRVVVENCLNGSGNFSIVDREI